MSHPPVTVTATTPLSEALRLMTVHRVHHLPVVAHDAQLVGMVSIDDLLASRSADWRPTDAVAAVMRAPTVSTTPTASLDEAVRLMNAHRVSALPVVDHGRTVGVLRQSDIILALAG
jgi:acetoin utilization protein AcuB